MFYDVRLYHKHDDVDLTGTTEQVVHCEEQLMHALVSAPTWHQALSTATAQLRAELPDEAAQVNWYRVHIARKDARVNAHANLIAHEGGIP